MNGPADVLSPEKAHPAFYGCYDWHSSVHGHWMLARLLRLFPDLPEAPQIKKALNANLTAENIEIEAAYFAKPGAQAFERTYGWAWTLKLAEELHASSSPEAKQWSQQPQAARRHRWSRRYIDFLPKQVYRSAPGCIRTRRSVWRSRSTMRMRSATSALKDMLIRRAATTTSASDADYPAKLRAERIGFPLAGAGRSGPDAPGAGGQRSSRTGSTNILPELVKGEPKNLLEIAVVSDRTDPQLGHLDGLNLSRAWCMLPRRRSAARQRSLARLARSKRPAILTPSMRCSTSPPATTRASTGSARSRCIC